MKKIILILTFIILSLTMYSQHASGRWYSGTNEALIGEYEQIDSSKVENKNDVIILEDRMYIVNYSRKKLFRKKYLFLMEDYHNPGCYATLELQRRNRKSNEYLAILSDSRFGRNKYLIYKQK